MLQAGVLFLAVWAQQEGSLAPKLVGKPPCSFAARATSSPNKALPSPDGAPLSVAEGTYDVWATCADLTAVRRNVQVKANTTTSPEMNVTPGSAKVLVRRGGKLSPAQVILYPHGGPYDPPISQHPANAPFKAAIGIYDAIVLDASDGSEARITPFEIKLKSKTHELELRSGAVRVRAFNNGKPTKALVRVFRRDGSEAASGVSGEPIPVSPGRFAVESSLGSSLDFAKTNQDIWVSGGPKPVEVEARFETGSLLVSVTSDGTAVHGRVLLKKPSAPDSFNHFTFPGHGHLTPGTFELTLEAEGLEGLGSYGPRSVTIRAKEETRLALDLSRARVLLEVQQDGIKVPLDAVALVRAGGGSFDIKPNRDGEYRLWPGRYEFAATIPGGRVVRDGPFEVTFGERVVRKVDFSMAAIAVSPLRGGKPAEDAEVLVFRPGAQEPVARGRGRCTLALAPGTYDIKVSSGPTVTWKEGVKVEARNTTRVDIHLVEADLGTPSGDDDEPPLPEGDAPE